MIQLHTSAQLLNERAVDIMLFLLAQGDSPTRRDWCAAIEDQFGELSEIDQRRMVDTGMTMLKYFYKKTPTL